MRKCTKCGTSKFESEFSFLSNTRRISTWCKSCVNSYNRSRYNAGKVKRDKDKTRTGARRYASRHKAENKERLNSYRRTLRHKVLEKYGNKCNRCPFNDPRVLQLDHVHGDGAEERRAIGHYAIYLRALNDTDGRYQLLCANCNWIKRIENFELRRLRLEEADLEALSNEYEADNELL
jgi:hypothetical protein